MSYESDLLLSLFFFYLNIHWGCCVRGCSSHLTPVIAHKKALIETRDAKHSASMPHDDDRPPPARSARVRPASSTASARRPSGVSQRKPTNIDPRFDPLFGGEPDQKLFSQNYQFLMEQEEKEEYQRRFRIKCLKCILRRMELEETGEDLEEYDLSDNEREVFGEEHAEDLRQLKLTPAPRVYRELEQLKRASELYRSRRTDRASTSRQQKVKHALMKNEMKAVKEGTKSKPYFPKRRELKKAVLGDLFDKLEQRGGKLAVDRYVAKKVRKH